MPYDHNPTYEQLLGHAEHHNIKGWLLRGCEREDANTLREAIKRQSAHRIARKVAEFLADG
jgi:hypothetical protein